MMMERDKARGPKLSETETNTKESGRMTFLMARANSGRPMVTCMMEIGSMTKSMGSACTQQVTALSMLVIGSTTFSMVTEKRLGQTGQSLKEHIVRGRSMAKGFTNTLMAPSMMESSERIYFMAKEL